MFYSLSRRYHIIAVTYSFYCRYSRASKRSFIGNPDIDGFILIFLA